MMAMGYPRKPRTLGQTQSASLPAPMGGVNAVDAASAMPPTDAVYAYNVIASELGTRVRTGWKEWATGLPSAPTTILPFSGGTSSNSKLFSACTDGVYDCTITNVTPTQSVAFSVTTGKAGRGHSTVMTTAAGRFLVYCDEENGLHVYEENGNWLKIAGATTQQWAPQTTYQAGNRVVSFNVIYECAVGGVSAAGAGPSTLGTGIVDGTCQWNSLSDAFVSVIGPSLGDQNLGLNADPGSFVFPTVWGGRLWFVEKNSSRAWYGEVGALYGTYTSFDFGAKMRHGGHLRSLYSWSYDAGAGLAQLLVALSDAGDVVIYGGTNPDEADAFGLKGSWFAGGFPSGRSIATEDSGELLVITKLGLLPASRLVSGADLEDSRTYATYKISPIFARLVESSGGFDGWACHIHPSDNALILLVPEGVNVSTTQWAQSFFGQKGWFRYRDIPMISAGVWNGRLYFGTRDGRICVHEGDKDGVLLTDPNTYSFITYSFLHAFQTFGNARIKRVHMLQPTIITESPSSPVEATAKYDYDMTEPGPPSGVTVASGALWDQAVWDQALWAGDYVASSRITGGLGMGRAVSVAVRGSSASRTIVSGTDVMFDLGGLL